MKIGILILGILIMTVVPYILGCSNGSILVSKYILHDDIRQHGSGNAGMTNFLRVFGKKLIIPVVLFDILKAVISVLLGTLGVHLMQSAGCDLLVSVQGKYIASLCCELGHMFPAFFGLKGGKGILSGGFIAIMIDWRLALVVWGSFLILAVITKYVSLGSVSTGVWFPIISILLFPDPVVAVTSIAIGGLIIWCHRSNISRLIHGTESKFSIHKNS